MKQLAQRSEQIGFDLTLIAELNLNDIKGVEAPSLDAWSTAAALAAVTEALELMVAVRPTFHLPALLAKQAANIDHISGGAVALNVVSSWWADEARKYGVSLRQHDDRYARTGGVARRGGWRSGSRTIFRFSGKYYQVRDNVLQPKPVSKPRPTIYAGGESDGGQRTDFAEMRRVPDARRSAGADRWKRLRDMSERREKKNLGRMKFGVAGYAIVRETKREAQEELRRITDVKQSRGGLCTTTSNGWRARNWSSAFRWRIIRCRIAACARVWWARRSRWRIRSGNSSGRRRPCCCCNSVRSWRKWSGLERR